MARNASRRIWFLAESADPRRVVGAFDAMYWTCRGPEEDELFERRKSFLLEACFAETNTYVRERILALLAGHGGTRPLDASTFPEIPSDLVLRAQALGTRAGRDRRRDRPRVND